MRPFCYCCAKPFTVAFRSVLLRDGGVIQRLSAALWELILLGAPKLAIDPRPIGRQ